MISGIIREELEGLEYVVQTRSKGSSRAWESMAAFNHKAVAINYAEDCYADNRTRQDYRVLELSSIQPINVILIELN